METLFIFRQSRHFLFDVILLDSTFPNLYLDLACKQLCFPPGKGVYIGETKVQLENFQKLFETPQNFIKYLSEFQYNYY